MDNDKNSSCVYGREKNALDCPWIAVHKRHMREMKATK